LIALDFRQAAAGNDLDRAPISFGFVRYLSAGAWQNI
jgi:hypothetical protein